MNVVDLVITVACILVVVILAFAVGYEFGRGDEADEAWERRERESNSQTP